MLTSRAALCIAGALTVLGGLGGIVWLAGNYASTPHGPDKGSSVTVSETRRAEIPAPDRVGVASTMLPNVDAAPYRPDAQLESRLESRFELMRQQLQAQQHRLTQQRAEITQLRRELQAGSASTLNTASDVVGESSEESVAPEQKRMQQLETEFVSEPVDNAGATTAVEEISAAVQQVFDTLGREAYDDSALEEAACVKTFCRLEFQHRNPAAMQEFIRQFPRHLGWQTDGHVDVIHNQDGSVSTVVYLSRDGYSLPPYNN